MGFEYILNGLVCQKLFLNGFIEYKCIVLL